ncbi:Ras-related protein Rab-32B [Araneus ventricosus]|uniref:Ras-related protein Rab-32B n=1 Tax=Araneus ventricosus TaxID=182803 RepID=A0A4Y2MFB3_ARAVE|nr:Ras-related protein Rab-32B [Araneus ventricosus]
MTTSVVSVQRVPVDASRTMNHYTTPSTYTEDTEDQNSSKYEMKELMFKLLVVGDYGVGKTAIIRRYTEGTFTQNYKITIGVDFAIKSLQWDENTMVTLQLWDIAGHERFGYMTATYYRHSQAAIIVFDLIRRSGDNVVPTTMPVIKQRDTNEDCAKTLASIENKLAEDVKTSFIDDKSVKDKSPPKQGVKHVNGDLLPTKATQIIIKKNPKENCFFNN